MKAGEVVASFFAERCCHVFAVSGAGNIRILDAISRLGKTEIICCHHEQACAQASIGYYRVSGRLAPVIVTCGGGSSNVVTGVVSAWMDSIPLMVIAGQESRRNDKLRAWGVQSFDLAGMVAGACKDAIRIANDPNIAATMDEAYRHCREGRPGPVVIEIPLDIQ